MALWHCSQHTLHLVVRVGSVLWEGFAVDFHIAGEFGNGHALVRAIMYGTCAAESHHAAWHGLLCRCAVGHNDFLGALHHVEAEHASAFHSLVVAHDGILVAHLGIDFHFRLLHGGDGHGATFCEVPVLLGVDVAESLAEVLRKLDSLFGVAVVVVATASHGKRHHRCRNEE